MTGETWFTIVRLLYNVLVSPILFPVRLDPSARPEREHGLVGEDPARLGRVLLRGRGLVQDRRVLQVLRQLRRQAQAGQLSTMPSSRVLRTNY